MRHDFWHATDSDRITRIATHSADPGEHRRSRWVATLIAIALCCTACTTSSSDEPNSARESQTSDQAATPIAPPDGETPEGSASGNESLDNPDQAAPSKSQLGFGVPTFDLEVATASLAVDGNAAPRSATDLIDIGVAAGTWSEAEGVRAIISVLLGELPQDAIPALNDLPHLFHGGVIDRARTVLDDPSTPADQRADLDRLTAFFFDDREPAGTSTVPGPTNDTEGALGANDINSGSGLQPIMLQTTSLGCRQIDEFILFGAQNTLTCFDEYDEGEGLRIFVPETEEFRDEIAALLVEQVEHARIGYEELAASTFGDVEILVSPAQSIKDPEKPNETALGHAASSDTGHCRIALFAPTTMYTPGSDMDFVLAHELFHCVQGFWGPRNATPFVEEAGADYFAYALTGSCPDFQIALGPDLDQYTAVKSLLSTSYEGWFFWAFLDEHGHLDSQAIAAVHTAAWDGSSIATDLKDIGLDLPAVLNEFYVRLMGPRLACGFQGSIFTGSRPVAGVEAVELKSSLWQGTRYQLTYSEPRAFAQSKRWSGPHWNGGTQRAER